MSDDTKHLDEHIRGCLVVFGCLMVLTIMTVAASYLDVPQAATVTIALCIATVKGTLVLLHFMHLVSEKKLIFYSLMLTAVFFVVLLVIPFAGDLGKIEILRPGGH